MTERFILDTNAASGLLRRHQAVSQRAAAVPLSTLAISAVTAAELYYGLAKRPAATTLATLVHEFLRFVDVVPWSEDIAPHYGTLRAALEVDGVTIGALDMMIAAHALAIDATLVTSDHAFKMITVLKIEDWTI